MKPATRITGKPGLPIYAGELAIWTTARTTALAFGDAETDEDADRLADDAVIAQRLHLEKGAA